jgi:nicotinamide-nucleotide amidase
MRAEILCIGTELLIGQVVNTNATFLAQELAAIGVDLYWMTTVGDNMSRVIDALKTSLGRADLVLISGGLGPTDDDLTVEAIANFLDEPMVERLEIRSHIEDMFKRRNRPMSVSNFKQALFPPSATAIPNPAGTACGVYLKLGTRQLMAFPGVPMELKEMWRGWARLRLEAEAGATIRSTLLRYVGIGESALAERVAPLLAGSNPTVAPYAGDWEVHLRVSAKAATVEAAEALMAPVVEQLKTIAPFYYGQDEETLPAVVGRLLKARGENMATAESCTGGLLASRMTDVVGSSDFILGGVVAYSVDVKRDLLGLPELGVLDQGIVSEAVAGALARSARQALGADWGVGITGYAGDAPGVPADEVGLVWLAIAGPMGMILAECQRFGGGAPRATIKFRATQCALALLRRCLMS